MRRHMYSLFCALFLLSACSNRAAVNDMYEGLEEVARLEQRFEQEQGPLVALERKEKDIYRQIMALGIEERNKRKVLAAEAEKALQEREKHLSMEWRSLQAAKKRFTKVSASAGRLRDAGLHQKGQELLRLMEQRYHTYDQLHQQYESALSHDRELYLLLQGDGVSFLPVQQQVRQINEEYEKVLQLNKEFNAWTDQYNVRKQEFYRKSGLHITVAE